MLRMLFRPTRLTARETVESYLLYRAAELTLQQGFDGFTIVDRATDRHTRTYVDPDPLYDPWYGPRFGFWRPSWRYYGGGYGWRTWDPFWGDPFWADRVDVRTVDRFEASAEIQMFRGAKPANDPRAFEAKAVVDNLGPRIVRPLYIKLAPDFFSAELLALFSAICERLWSACSSSARVLRRS